MTKSIPSTPAYKSTIVVREERVPGLGRFTAFEDGRVRLLHVDRTIIEIDAECEFADMIARDGSIHKVRVACPVGVERYLDEVLSFGYETFTAPQERVVRGKRFDEIEAEMALIRERLTPDLSGFRHPQIGPNGCPVYGGRISTDRHCVMEMAATLLARNEAALAENGLLASRLAALP